jgi:hypothetical protein
MAPISQNFGGGGGFGGRGGALYWEYRHCKRHRQVIEMKIV